eukprot:61195_1
MVYIVKGVSSLLSKTKRESIDIETTKLAGEDVAVNVVEIKTPVPLWRQYSEPDAKAMREIERDLKALPLTPPFDPHGDVTGDAPSDLPAWFRIAYEFNVCKDNTIGIALG